jgi:hypothetical protein
MPLLGRVCPHFSLKPQPKIDAALLGTVVASCVFGFIMTLTNSVRSLRYVVEATA